MNLIPAAGFPEREPVTIAELNGIASSEFGENLDKNAYKKAHVWPRIIDILLQLGIGKRSGILNRFNGFPRRKTVETVLTCRALR